MTSAERLANIRLKVERAKQHLYELELVLDRFRKAQPYTIESEIDPQTGHKVGKVRGNLTPPDGIGLIAGDVIHNLRSALDHLAYQLVCANSQIPDRQTSFPIFDSAAKYAADHGRHVQLMAHGAINAISATKPYFGGTDDLWHLHALDIADKHHALLTIITMVPNISVNWRGSAIDWLRGLSSFGDMSMPGIGHPLKDGDVIFRIDPDKYDDPQVTIDVALAEAGFFKRQPILITLQNLLDLVDSLILSFKPYLA
jgi:hypothetical protein